MNTDVAELEMITAQAERRGEVRVEFYTEEVRSVLKYIAELELEVPLNVGDIVSEIGCNDPDGTIISITEGPNETMYTVKLFKGYARMDTINYYRNEIRLHERAQ